jgi:hypothetical protein
LCHHFTTSTSTSTTTTTTTTSSSSSSSILLLGGSARVGDQKQRVIDPRILHRRQHPRPQPRIATAHTQRQAQLALGQLGQHEVAQTLSV